MVANLAEGGCPFSRRRARGFGQQLITDCFPSQPRDLTDELMGCRKDPPPDIGQPVLIRPGPGHDPLVGFALTKQNDTAAAPSKQRLRALVDWRLEVECV